MLRIDEDEFTLVPTSNGDIEIDDAALDEAACRWRRGEKKEALHWLERALGRDFDGLGDMTPEQIR